MSEYHSKSVYGKQLEMCYDLTCNKLKELTLEIRAANKDWTLSDKAKLVKIGELKAQMAAVKNNAYTKINEYCDEYKKRLDEYIASIGGKQMDKDDIFLLQSPIVMVQEEFAALVEKHKGNYWMMRALKDYSDKVNNSLTDEAKMLSMPYNVYSFERKRQRADQAANGFIGFVSEAHYDDTSKECGSLSYGAYLAMNGYEYLDEICSE